MAISKKGIVVNTIIALVMAAIFILVGASVIGNFFAGFCRPEGAIVDATKVVCFGDGTGHYIHCLNKETGNPDFKLGAAPNWGSGADAKSTPTLTKDAIYSGLGQYFVSFAVTGAQNYCGEKVGHTIPTGVAVDADEKIACFGGGADHTLHCQDTGSGKQVFQVKPKADTCPWWARGQYGNVNGKELEVGSSKETYDSLTEQPAFGESKVEQRFKEKYGGDPPTYSTANYYLARECRAESTPAIVDNIVYFALGNKVCKISTDSSGDVKPNANDCKSYDWTIPTGIAVDKDKGLVCFGGGKDHNMHCLKTDFTKDSVDELRVHAGNLWKIPDARSTPTISGDWIYFGLGNRFCAVDSSVFNGGAVLEGNRTENRDFAPRAWCTYSEHAISTGSAIDETNELVCFGGGGDHTVHCLNTPNGAEDFSIHAGKWNKPANAVSTPLIVDSKLYVAIGDRVCAYKLPVSGPKNKDFKSASYKYTTDTDALWDSCADLDQQIATGIAGYKEPTPAAGGSGGAGSGGGSSGGGGGSPAICNNNGACESGETISNCLNDCSVGTEEGPLDSAANGGNLLCSAYGANYVVCGAQNKNDRNDQLDKLWCCSVPGATVDYGAKQKKDSASNGGDLLCSGFGANYVMCGAQNKNDRNDQLDMIYCCSITSTVGNKKGPLDSASNGGDLLCSMYGANYVACGAKNNPNDNAKLDKLWCCPLT